MITKNITAFDTQAHRIVGPFQIPDTPFHDDIMDAISSRRVMEIRYANDRLPRRFAPYLYRLAMNGNLTVLGMQIDNQNSLDGTLERRTFTVSKIKSLELTNDIFVPVDTFSPGAEQSHSSGIIECVVPWI